ncbi:hypothetical protein D5F01_LYC19484 [Larimichthys crocea]|uniref:Uncharacterized protein n=1 Tax=Larimichthys crocea TaxID=215358 RepID=A0A6G0HSD2_LARCR|nr:uncharacterized protein LOC104922050 [Larimichthys crocea]KAE8282090.1 hypothetical protein D5F01_LYC19484 [Larimichthys crocea]
MLRFLCCCCSSSEDSESQPLLDPRSSHLNGAGSARQTRQTHSDAQSVKKIGKLVMRRVCVPELDQRFSDMAETFNQQQERYEVMVRHIRNLRQIYGCNHNDGLALTECLGKIIQEHEAKYRVSLKIQGYDFSLNVVPVRSEGEREEQPPPHLRLAQDELKATSESAKATISKGTTLQELIGWLLRSKDQMADQVKGAAATYQEQGRLNENLKENMMEVRRAKELSLGYKQQAGEVFTEAAHIAGAYL